jgi:hypothetical protein|tara:strand:- start:155 stop:361 length:207 start_codon:yes stop_codon:yes gene_type:complete
MSIEGLITGVVLLFTPVEQMSVVEKVWRGAVLTDKVIIKTEEGTWGASGHEEINQIVKDIILKQGGLK